MIDQLKSCTSDLTGQIFTRLHVKSFAGYFRTGRKRRYAKWVCSCKCGNEAIVAALHLKRGDTKSCGCIPGERLLKNRFKDGTPPEHSVWKDMLARCRTKTHKSYHWYGGRGIKICKAWHDSFEQFFEDMGSRPGPEYSIERVNVNGDYTPENCTWADPVTQARNKRVKPNSKSGVSGVRPTGNGKRWVAAIVLNRKHIHLGVFDELEDAIKARKDAEAKYWLPQPPTDKEPSNANMQGV